MSIIEWPSGINPSEMSWRLISNSKTFTSVFTGSSQTVRFPGSKWHCSLSFTNLTDDESRELEALMASLDGESGRVKISHWARKGVANMGTPLVSASNQTGRYLQTKGWKPNTNVLRKGDYLTVNNELKMVTENIKVMLMGMRLLPFPLCFDIHRLSMRKWKLPNLMGFLSR
ncbi:Uncharacterised protein [Providencia stuartii]|nr:Uncharacterised protein [Providencia stuartii]